ncbi:DUF4845 domain-containing protein [Nitrincola tibetensis]|uniref:DUF4845 domain-containing protein n=1 Tax=Nitrincola tibetensis TaxID=2219697 RepID=A0A364NKW1_9GAMM|nr:DUF4845 domain-containing protein [Nitrincola tibetensis]RAU17769.1 DUF4845 domain-containing protein [Nitrincola tibetensis]
MKQHPRSAQRGATFFGVLSVVIVAGIFLSIAFKLFTPYWEHKTLVSVVKSASEDPEELRRPVSQIRSNLERRFVINQVTLASPEALTIVDESGMIKFTLDYEVRVPMFANVDAVVKFEEYFEGRKP